MMKVWPEGTLALIKSTHTHGMASVISLMLGRLRGDTVVGCQRVWTIIAARPPANVWLNATVCTGLGNTPRVLRRIRLDELPQYMTWIKSPTFDKILKGE